MHLTAAINSEVPIIIPEPGNLTKEEQKANSYFHNLA